MTASFTPGPWTDVSHDESQWGVYDSRGWLVAQAQQIKVLRDDLKQVERTANARLIAASPTMHQYIEKQAAKGCMEARLILESIHA